MTTPFSVGALVQSDVMHGIFGTVADIRPAWNGGPPTPGLEYLLRNGSVSSWINERQIESATLDDVVAHYGSLLRDLTDQLKTFRRADEDPRYIHISGNPVNGFTFTGPFATHDDALTFAEDERGSDWWLAELSEPNEPSEDEEEA